MLEGTGSAGTADEDEVHATGLRIANWWLKARRLREEMFGSEMFAEPAWDILLDLYTAEAKGESVQISSLAVAARVPHSTAIRWAKNMTRSGFLVRERDPTDARRVHIRLSPWAKELMENYLARLIGHGASSTQIMLEPSG
ncbi:conserved hypothetical protein [Novosphingobium sp. PP1Y]|nr:conserved hypothetical protein [Novosphingobium sp. PP1Y]